MSTFVAAESAANPAAIRAAAADLDRVAGMITGHGQAVTQALNSAPPTFSDLFAEQLRDRVRQNEAAWRSALSSVVYAAGVTRAWADDVEWFQAQQRALGAQIAAATAGTAGLTAPAITPGAPPETIANSLQHFSTAVDNHRAELNAQGSHQSGALLNQLQERAAQRAADLRSGPTPASLDRLDAAGALPGAASSIFAGTGWTPARPMADLLALVSAGLLPGSALTMNWKDLITTVTGEWAHLLDRSFPAIPDGSPLAGAFIPAVNPLTGGAHLRPVPAVVQEAFAGLDASLALLLGGLYPRLLANAGTAPAAVQAVAVRGLQAGAPAGPVSPMTMNGGMPDLAALNTSFIGRLSQKILASNDLFIDAWATGVIMMSNIKKGSDPDAGEFWGALTLKHNQARDDFAELLEQIVLAGGDPTGLGLDYVIDKGAIATELKIDGAAADESGSYGRADIYYKVGNYIWFWEVKGTSKENPTSEDFKVLSKLAAKEVDIDVREFNNNEALKAQEDEEHVPVWAMPGFRANSAKVFYWTDYSYFTWEPSVNAYIVGDGLPEDGGAVVYHRLSSEDDAVTPRSRFYTEPSPPQAAIQPPAATPAPTLQPPAPNSGLVFNLDDPDQFLPGPKVDISGLTDPVRDAVVGGGQILVDDVKDYFNEVEKAVDAVGTGLDIAAEASAMPFVAVGGLLSGEPPTADLAQSAVRIAIDLSKWGG